MARNKLQEGEGMNRPKSSSSPTPSPRVSKFQDTIGEDEMAQFNAGNVQNLLTLCEDCCTKCKDKGFTDEATQCEELKTQCESASQALASGARMATDWFAFALAAMKLIMDILSKLGEPKQA